MKRITYKDSSGNWVLACSKFDNYIKLKYPAHLKGEAVNRLAEYENIGTVEEFYELKQAEKEGRLKILPVAIGDKIYTIEDKLDQCYRCDFAKRNNISSYRECIHYCRNRDNLDDIYPDKKYDIVEHIVEAFLIKDEDLTLEDAGRWDYSELETFSSDDGFGIHKTYEAAKNELMQAKQPSDKEAIIKDLVSIYENCNILDNSIIRDVVDKAIRYIKHGKKKEE